LQRGDDALAHCRGASSSRVQIGDCESSANDKAQEVRGVGMHARP
jgi:hypothetical protein